jgi:hypothetical protein
MLWRKESTTGREQPPPIIIAQSDENILFRNDGGELRVRLGGVTNDKLELQDISLEQW